MILFLTRAATETPTEVIAPPLPASVPQALIDAAATLADLSASGDFESLPEIPLPRACPPRFTGMGLHWWSAGRTRLAFGHNAGWCVKVPRSPGHAMTNRIEAELLRRISDADRALFAETYALPNDVLVQRTYVIDPWRSVEYQRKHDDILRAQCRFWIGDVHHANIGWAPDGRWVFIDWANIGWV